MATWSIAVTAKETLSHTLCFVAYHLELGASRIFIFLDDPHDVAIPYLNKNECVSVVICDDDYWQIPKKTRPVRQEIRQIHNANFAYMRCEEDWLIHMDIDEYLAPFETETSIAKSLSKETHDLIKILPMEPLRVDGGDGAVLFHGGYYGDKQTLSKELFGKKLHKSLLLEHSRGKCFTRTKLQSTRVMLHRSRMPDEKLRTQTSSDLRLLHFTSFGVKNWAKKYHHRYNVHELYPFGKSLTKTQQLLSDYAVFRAIELAIEELGVNAVENLYRSYKTPLPNKLLKLAGIVDILEFSFSFTVVLSKYFDFVSDQIDDASDLFDWD